ncbi:MAG: Hsp20/alpha crystallin family protein [Candidatus Bathyarchaeota archaeon]|nr:MAG: Hsp20/alpha crystallin family protein [Candidatus Bathyarchaeota archaeon]
MGEHFEDDEVFRDIDSFYKNLMNRMLREMKDFERMARGGAIKGRWNIKPISNSGARGFVARGQFQFGGDPLQTAKRALVEQRQPLTDVFVEDEKVKIYMELPGVDKSDIKLDVTDELVEVKAKNFTKTVEMPTGNVDFTQTTATYKNGVLEVTIPKIKKTSKDTKKRSISIE